MRKKWQFKLVEGDYIFVVFSYFFQSFRKKSGTRGKGAKKLMKQNAKSAETKIFIAFI